MEHDAEVRHLIVKSLSKGDSSPLLNRGGLRPLTLATETLRAFRGFEVEAT